MITIHITGKDIPTEQIGIEQLPQILSELGDGEDATLWVDMENPTPEEEHRILTEIFKFHPLAILDCQRERLNPDRGDHLPKVEDYDSYLFSIINPIDVLTEKSGQNVPADEWLHTRQLNAFIGLNFLVTHHYEPSRAIRNTLTSCTKNPKLLEHGPDYTYHRILDDIVDQYSPILDLLDGVIDDLETEVFHKPSTRTLERLLRVKRHIFKMKRIVSYQREMVYHLSRGEFDLISQKEIAYYRNVFDHLLRATDLIESYRDVLTSLLDAYLSMTSNRMNEIMKVLTLFSTFFLPLTFVVGLYGMNFDVMPELHWKYGYALVWFIMIGVGIAMFIFFKKRKWL